MSDNNTFIGELNERITIKSFVDIKSTISGESTKQLQVLKNCWAKVEDVSGSEEVEGRVVYVNVKAFTVYFDKRLTGASATDKQIEYNGETYQIVSDTKIGRKRYLKLKAFKRE